MEIVIKIPENEYRYIKEIYEKNDNIESTYSYIYHGTPLPENTTNGDIIKTMFSNMKVGFITESQIGVYFTKNASYATVFDLNWWNAPYKEVKADEDSD